MQNEFKFIYRYQERDIDKMPNILSMSIKLNEVLEAGKQAVPHTFGKTVLNQ